MIGNKLNIICFGAHPDDCEVKVGGLAAKCSAKGHNVKFVSLTNGDIGHVILSGHELIDRRREEASNSAEILGVRYEILNNHDGELVASIENRKTVTRLIRHWNADIVISPRTNDYHPDHRAAATLVQDASFMVVVPKFCPEVTHLPRMPVFLLMEDNFSKPQKFQPDIVIDIDDAIDKKMDACLAHESQFIDRGYDINGEQMVITDENSERERLRAREFLLRWFEPPANKYREKLIEIYGREKGEKIKFAEALEMSEYGRRIRSEELFSLFGF